MCIENFRKKDGRSKSSGIGWKVFSASLEGDLFGAHSGGRERLVNKWIHYQNYPPGVYEQMFHLEKLECPEGWTFFRKKIDADKYIIEINKLKNRNGIYSPDVRKIKFRKYLGCGDMDVILPKFKISFKARAYIAKEIFVLS